MQILNSKKLKKILFAFGAVLVILVSGEIFYFHHILSQEEELKNADVILVFAGSSERIKAGFELADGGYAPVIILSPASENQMEAYKSRFAESSKISWLIEDKARSTAENAIFTKNIILNNGFNSAILLTSKHHLPRSYFLLRTVLIGEDISVQPYGNSIGSKNTSKRSIPNVIEDFHLEEFVKLWGSALQLIKYKIKKDLTL